MATTPKPTPPKVSVAQLEDAVRYYNIFLPQYFLLGLTQMVAPKARREKRKKSIQKVKLSQLELAGADAMSLTVETKVEVAKTKQDTVIATAKVAEAQRPNGKAAQLSATSTHIGLLQATKDAAQIELDTRRAGLAGLL